MRIPHSWRVIAPAIVSATATVLAITAPAQASQASAASATPGSVTQVAGQNGCYTMDGSSTAGAGTCRNIRGGGGATTILVSPDGRSAYLVGYGKSGKTQIPVLSVFQRDRTTGVLHQLPGKAGCFSRDGSSEDGPNTCTNARDLDTGDATSLAMSSDGRFLYVASQYRPPGAGSATAGGVAIFSRNTTSGALHQLPGKLGCVSATGGSEDGPGTCAFGRELNYVSNVHITPDQKFLYASVYDDVPHSGIAIFRRNLVTGTLTQLAGKDGCITDDGTTAQSGTSKVCRAMPNLGAPWDVATPDNHFAYVPDARHNLVQAFRRDAAGGLVPLTGKGACVSDTGSSPLGPSTCVNGRGLYNAERAVLSKNKNFIYTSSYLVPSAIAVLNRNPVTGLLSQRSGVAACVSKDGTSGPDTADTCRNGRGLNGGYAGAVSPAGDTLYYAEWGYGTGSSGNPDSGFVIFHLSPLTGGFTQLSGKLGCVTSSGASEDGPGTCQRARAVAGGYQIQIAAGGRDIYVAASTANGVAFFHAAP